MKFWACWTQTKRSVVDKFIVTGGQPKGHNGPGSPCRISRIDCSENIPPSVSVGVLKPFAISLRPVTLG